MLLEKQSGTQFLGISGPCLLLLHSSRKRLYSSSRLGHPHPTLDDQKAVRGLLPILCHKSFLVGKRSLASGAFFASSGVLLVSAPILSSSCVGLVASSCVSNGVASTGGSAGLASAQLLILFQEEVGLGRRSVPALALIFLLPLDRSPASMVDNDCIFTGFINMTNIVVGSCGSDLPSSGI